MKYASLLFVFLSFSLVAQTTLDVGSYLDVRQGRIIKNVRLTIDSTTGRILKISAGSNNGSATYSYPDATLIPGLIDTHTHLCLNDQSLDGGFDRELEREVRTPLNQRLDWARRHAQELLKSGFTVLRDLGNCGEWGEKILSRDFSTEGQFPTLIYSGKGLAASGGQFFAFTDPELVAREYLILRGEQKLKDAISHVKMSGATWLKLYADNDPNPQNLPQNILSDAVRLGHQVGLKVAIHAVTHQAIDRAIIARPDSIEHAVELDFVQMSKLKKLKIPLVMTDLAGELRELFYQFTFDFNRSYHAKAPLLLNARAKAARDENLLLVFGSDYYFDLQVYGYNFGQGTIAALLGLKTQGFTPLEIIQMASWKAAVLLGLSADYGEIAPYLKADFVGVRGNPLENIDSLRTPLFVMKNGKMINPNQ